ncbi:hypothetical protein EV714DRAFT_270403 [Schizophyllum commune]
MSMNAQPHMAVDNTVGASLVGALCAAALYGVSCVQTWWYFTRYGADVWYIKALVLLVFVFDTVHQILISHTVYFYVVSNYNNPGSLNNMTWFVRRFLWPLEVLFNGMIGLLVQGFLTMRVWKLSNKCKWLTGLITGLVVSEFACSVVFTAKSLQLETWSQLSSMKPLSMTVNVLGAVADVIIAAGLFFYLHRSRTGFKKSDTMISKLIMFAVSTGMLTSVCAIGSLISISVWGDTLIYVAFYFRQLGQTYSNSLLATLNARKDIRELIDDPESLSFSLQTRSKSIHNRTFGSQRPTNISVQIETIQERVREQEQRSQDDLRESVRLTERFLERITGRGFGGNSQGSVEREARERRGSGGRGLRSRGGLSVDTSGSGGRTRGSGGREARARAVDEFGVLEGSSGLDKRATWRTRSSMSSDEDEHDLGTVTGRATSVAVAERASIATDQDSRTSTERSPRFPPGTPLASPPDTPRVRGSGSRTPTPTPTSATSESAACLSDSAPRLSDGVPRLSTESASHTSHATLRTPDSTTLRMPEPALHIPHLSMCAPAPSPHSPASCYPTPVSPTSGSSASRYEPSRYDPSTVSRHPSASSTSRYDPSASRYADSSTSRYADSTAPLNRASSTSNTPDPSPLSTDALLPF